MIVSVRKRIRAKCEKFISEFWLKFSNSEFENLNLQSGSDSTCWCGPCFVNRTCWASRTSEASCFIPARHRSTCCRRRGPELISDQILTVGTAASPLPSCFHLLLLWGLLDRNVSDWVWLADPNRARRTKLRPTAVKTPENTDRRSVSAVPTCLEDAAVKLQFISKCIRFLTSHWITEVQRIFYFSDFFIKTILKFCLADL